MSHLSWEKTTKSGKVNWCTLSQIESHHILAWYGASGRPVQSAGITRATAARKLVSTLIAGLTYCTFLGARLSRSRTMAETQCK